jgi:serine/threonine protein kinase
VATALQYLHDSANLVHGDIKLDNVLLKSDAAHPHGFVAKRAAWGRLGGLGSGVRRVHAWVPFSFPEMRCHTHRPLFSSPAHPFNPKPRLPHAHGLARLSDFGLSKILGQEAGRDVVNVSGAGAGLGLTNGRGLGLASDWGLGGGGRRRVAQRRPSGVHRFPAAPPHRAQPCG